MKLKNAVTIKQTIAPATIQLLEMVQLNTVELGRYLTEQAMENPAIDIDELAAASKSGELAGRVEWLGSFGSQRPESVGSADDDDTPDSPIASCTKQTDVRSYLLSMLLSSDADRDTKRIYRYLIGCVDSRGFLSEDWDKTAQKLGVERKAVEACVAVMRSLPPTGICAEDVRGCLTAQLSKSDSVARSIVGSFLEELSHGHYTQISKSLGVPVSAVRSAEKRIKGLYPYPSSALEGSRDADGMYIYPDLSVEQTADGLSISLCRPYSPHLKISSFCRELKKSTDDESVLSYIDERMAAAGRLYQNVCRCEKTVLSCFETLAKMQSDYLCGVSDTLKPMTLADISDSTGLSISTVSRTVRGKYIQCKRGVIPAKLFFTAKLESKGGARSADEAKKLLREVIDGEDKASPLSDAQLSDILTQKGFSISRRTVAKYRDELSIPGTYVRKK